MAMSTAVGGPAPWLTIGRGSVTYTQAEAEEVLAGFAFGTEQLIWPNNFILAADPGTRSTGPVTRLTGRPAAWPGDRARTVAR